MTWFKNSSNATDHQIVPIISEKMQHIYDAVYNHVNMRTNGALLVTGNWGSGKTYYFKNFLSQK
jgi:type II secretory ATPase GspE/PulE/Tfp pilus assembly ATPase PilB-like protein